VRVVCLSYAIKILYRPGERRHWHRAEGVDTSWIVIGHQNAAEKHEAERVRGKLDILPAPFSKQPDYPGVLSKQPPRENRFKIQLQLFFIINGKGLFADSH